MVRADLSFDRAVIMTIALIRARASRPPAWRWQHWLAGELRLVWGSARALCDTRRAEIEVAKLTPSERAARQLELAAALAASAIPSRREEAERLRAEAAAIRVAAQKDAA